MAGRPELHANIYPEIDPALFASTQKGNVVLVIDSNLANRLIRV